MDVRHVVTEASAGAKGVEETDHQSGACCSLPHDSTRLRLRVLLENGRVLHTRDQGEESLLLSFLFISIFCFVLESFRAH